MNNKCFNLNNAERYLYEELYNIKKKYGEIFLEKLNDEKKDNLFQTECNNLFIKKKKIKFS